METAAFKYCFGNSYSSIESIFKTFPKECVLELSFNKLPDELFTTGIFKDEYLEKILTTFATFKQKLSHKNVQNHFQAIGSREIELAKVPHKNGFIKCFLETPLPQEFDLLKISQNVLYVRRISLSINIGNWEISKVVKIASQVKDHKKLIWKYGIEDVLNPQIFNQVYYKFSYCGPKEDITKSFISVLSNIFPRNSIFVDGGHQLSLLSFHGQYIYATDYKINKWIWYKSYISIVKKIEILKKHIATKCQNWFLPIFQKVFST